MTTHCLQIFTYPPPNLQLVQNTSPAATPLCAQLALRQDQMALECIELKHKHDIAVLKLDQLRVENNLKSENLGIWEFLSWFAQIIVSVTLFLFLMAVAVTGMRAALEKIDCWLGV